MKKLPWDLRYIKIAFHVVVTIVVIYTLKLLTDLLAYVCVHFNMIVDNIGQFFSTMGKAFSPLIMALLIAYILNPLVDFFQQKYEIFEQTYLLKVIKKCNFLTCKKQQKEKTITFKKRTAGTVLSYLAIGLPLVGVPLGLFWHIGHQQDGTMPEKLATRLTMVVYDMEDMYTRIQLQLVEWGFFDYVSQFLSSVIHRFSSFSLDIGQRIASFPTHAGTGILSFILAWIIGFYFLKDKAYFQSKLKEILYLLFPSKIGKKIPSVLMDIHDVFSGYIQGQLIDGIVVALLIGLWLSFLNIHFAVLIGIISGFSNIIPFFGALTGFVLAVLSALLGGNMLQAFWAAIGILIIQQLDGVFIQPKIVGTSVKLGPVAVILSLWVAGRLFGFWGMIWAVPTCAIVKMFASNFIKRRLFKK